MSQKVLVPSAADGANCQLVLEVVDGRAVVVRMGMVGLDRVVVAVGQIVVGVDGVLVVVGGAVVTVGRSAVVEGEAVV